MNVLVTGGTGFIGYHLVKELSKSENNIYCVIRNKEKAERLLTPFNARLIHADITEKDAIKRSLDKKIDVLFHCAGCVDNKNKENLYKVNVLGTERMCELSMELGIERMVYTSSISVVSGNENVPLVEDLPYKATNPYGESKIQAEIKALEYRKKGLKIAIIRPCMVYGEGEPHLLKTLCWLAKHRLFPVINSGDNRLHLVYVKNVVDLMIFALINDGMLKGAFFIADKEVLTVKEIIHIMVEALGAPSPYNIHIPSLIIPFLLCLPYMGKRISFFLKDRVYSIDKIISLGFKHAYPARVNFAASCKSVYGGG
ncbi:MAG: NAD(P)-dependent oxidoreductase [Candidatus Omnitrophica bacterium]|nr:NAD(P)-dependent oxidoreductase [Candidatus Omnitrophota bacterium]